MGCEKVIYEFKGMYEFLSNFYEYEFEYEGRKYSTSEHAFQAAKTNDKKEFEAIANAPTPGKSKKLGRSCTLREDWEEDKLAVMFSILEAKFSGDLKWKLLETGNALLVEGNIWGDTFWGVDLKTGEGENYLGRILMKVREEIYRELGGK